MRLSDVEILRSYNLFISYNEILNSLCAEWKGFNQMTLGDYKKTRKVER